MMGDKITNILFIFLRGFSLLFITSGTILVITLPILFGYLSNGIIGGLVGLIIILLSFAFGFNKND